MSSSEETGTVSQTLDEMQDVLSQTVSDETQTAGVPQMDANAYNALMKMLKAQRSKRGITKPLFNKKKARAKNKLARKARKANTGSKGKGSCSSYTNRAGAHR